ncbi:MAG: hypothetical protein CMO81_03185 [Waddliaceae bacterium]|nr:hypothetical protein [Waddliaceae bacterium]
MSKKKPTKLREEDFIHEESTTNPYPMWFFAGLIVIVLVAMFLSGQFTSNTLSSSYNQDPFRQVSNREISLFLWQYPRFMRVNSTNKSSYLSGFRDEDYIRVRIARSEEYAVAPPELFFHYHAWKRLLKPHLPLRKIQAGEFSEFLHFCQIWHPRNWAKSPASYKDLVSQLHKEIVSDFDDLPLEKIPRDVQIAFQGWKNYFREGEEINQQSITHAQMQEFLAEHPEYGRNYWRNILSDYVPRYLESTLETELDPNAVIAQGELSSFLRVAYFNHRMKTDLSQLEQNLQGN